MHNGAQTSLRREIFNGYPVAVNVKTQPVIRLPGFQFGYFAVEQNAVVFKCVAVFRKQPRRRRIGQIQCNAEMRFKALR
jgi:hypothetical protein